MFRKLADNLVLAAVTAVWLTLAANASGQSTAPTVSPTSAPTTRPYVQGRRMIWDRTRVAVDRAQEDAIIRNVLRAQNTPGNSSYKEAPLVKAAYLGIASSPASDVLRKQLGLRDGTGLVIEFIEPGSPAAAAGIEPYDIAVRLNEQILVNPQQLAVLVRTFDPGTEVKLGLVREGKPIDVLVLLAERAMKPLASNTGDKAPSGDDRFTSSDNRIKPAASTYQFAEPDRQIRENDLVLFKLTDVEGPGVLTMKQEVVGGKGTLRLPRLVEPVNALGCTPVQLKSSVRNMYRSTGVDERCDVDVFVCPQQTNIKSFTAREGNQ